MCRHHGKASAASLLLGLEVDLNFKEVLGKLVALDWVRLFGVELPVENEIGQLHFGHADPIWLWCGLVRVVHFEPDHSVGVNRLLRAALLVELDWARQRRQVLSARWVMNYI